jgi:hypothetical protein
MFEVLLISGRAGEGRYLLTGDLERQESAGGGKARTKITGKTISRCEFSALGEKLAKASSLKRRRLRMGVLFRTRGAVIAKQ